MTDISIIICTHNRSDLLKECLESLKLQTINSKRFELIVVDNSSTDRTTETAKKFDGFFENFKVIQEETLGLSYARNRGFREAQSDWIFYLDDDALASENLIEKALWVIENVNCNIFGGVYLPWYKYGQPKWYKDQYASNKLRYKKIQKLSGSNMLSGGVFACKKSILEQYNGFDTSLGMSGNQVGYGEETDLQIRMKKDNHALIYVPDLIIYHLVAPYKLNLSWFFKSHFNFGRDFLLMNKININSNFTFIKILCIALLQSIVLLTINLTKFMLSKSYYLENLLIDTFRKPAKRAGMLYYILKRRSDTEK